MNKQQERKTLTKTITLQEPSIMSFIDGDALTPTPKLSKPGVDFTKVLAIIGKLKTRHNLVMDFCNQYPKIF